MNRLTILHLLLFYLFIIESLVYARHSSSYYDSVNAILNKINYYDVLNVNKDSSIDEIKRSFRTLALEYHPDKNKDNIEKYNLITEAKEVLTDPVKRKEYDDLLENGIPAHVRYYGRYAHMWGAPEHDIRWVLFWFITISTILKYSYELYNHKRSIELAKKTQYYKTRLNLYLQEKGIDPKKYKKMMKKNPNDPKLKEFELDVIVHGAEAPTVWDLLPISIIRGIFNLFKWIIWEKILGKGPTKRERLKKSLEKHYNRELTEEEVDLEIKKIEEYEERFRSSNKYKRALRWWKKNK